MNSLNVNMMCEGMKAFRENVPFDPTQDFYWREGWNEEHERAIVKSILRILKG